MRILFLPLIFSMLTGQLDTTIQNIENMPLRTKLLWGEKGFFRQINFGPDSRKDELKLRVKMLQNHQKLALVSLGLVAYQSYLGNQMVKGDYTKQAEHKMFSKITWSSYMTSASLSYLAPPAQKYNKRVSSMKIHQWLSYVHFAGMMALPVLGMNIATSNDYDKALSMHQNVATVTFTTLSLSALLTFYRINMRLFYSILFCSAVFAQTAQISSSKITYFGSHFMHDWVGVSSSVSSELNYNKESNTGSVSVGIRLDSFDSKLSSRDSNMLFYTEAIDYPIILFNSNKINIKADSIFIEGDLTFHGITKQIKTVATMFTSENPEVKGSFSINLSDYNVERPALLFVKIRDEIRIDYSFIIK